jgi:hypothetical protein
MGKLELLNPKGLFLLGALVPLVALYVLKVRRKTHVVASTWLFREAHRDLLARHPFRKLVPETTLVLEALAIVALSAALARPTFESEGIDGDVLAIVIDTSASMGTRVGQGPERRIDKAREIAERAIAATKPGTATFVVEDAGTPRLLGAPEKSRERTTKTLATLTVHDVPGDLSQAVALAADRLRGLPGKKSLLVVTDGAVENTTLPVVRDAAVEVLRVGDAQENSGIVRFYVRSKKSPTPGLDAVEAFALVKSYGTRPADLYVTCTVAGETSPRASRRLLLPAGGEAPVTLAFDARPDDRGKAIYVQASPYDALPLDDVAYGKVPAGARMPVILATDRPYSWLERALESDEDVALQKLSLADVERVNLDDDALLVSEGACPSDARVAGRDVLVVGPPAGSCLGVSVGKPVDVPRLTSWESGDPRLRFLALDGVRFATATPLDPGSTRGTLVRSDRGALVVDASVPGRTATLLGFAVGDTDWPLRASFVLFVRNVVELAREHRSAGAAGPTVTGGTLRVAAPVDATYADVTRDGDEGYSRRIPTKGGFVVVNPVDRAGLYRVTFAGARPKTVVVPVNLTHAAESDVRAKELTTGGRAVAEARAPSPIHREFSSLLAILGALFVLSDIWVLTRAPRRSSGPRSSGATS